MSTNGTLLNHCGASVVSKDVLGTIAAPEPTKTWYPVRHRDVLNSVEESLDQAGFQIRKSQLSLSNHNHRFFGVLDIASPLADGVSLSVGVRNSNDKSFPIGFCVGNRTFVCDNLCFSSEVVISKRHTRFGNDRYQEGVAAAIERLNEYRELETQRILTLQSTELSDQTAESVVLRAWEKGIVGTRLLRTLLEEWRQPSFDDFKDRTAWSLLAAFTHVVKARQRRYPHRSAKDVMHFQSLLTS